MDDKTEYTIPQGPSEADITEKGSKFIGYVFPVRNKDDIAYFLHKLQEDHKNARHFCYAWVLGTQYEETRSNDDGEPSGTAGKPILQMIQSHGYTNCLVVVVRYFGGILLGTGGLVQAYKLAARKALELTTAVTQKVTKSHSYSVPYEKMNAVMQVLKREGWIYSLEENYPQVHFTIEIPLGEENKLPGFTSES